MSPVAYHYRLIGDKTFLILLRRYWINSLFSLIASYCLINLAEMSYQKKRKTEIATSAYVKIYI